MQAKHSHAHTPNLDEQEESIEKDDISVTPLATPLIAGPGTIATVMSLTNEGNVILHSLAVLIGVIIVLAGTYLLFYYSGLINKKLSKSELNVITRLMGLLLAIIAVQMAVTGLEFYFPDCFMFNWYFGEMFFWEFCTFPVWNRSIC